MTISRLGVTVMGIVGVAAVLSPKPHPLIVWNASASVPIGLYWVSPTHYTRGELVFAKLPAGIQALAAERKYLPLHIPVLKRIAGVPGDHVCAANDTIFVNGAAVARRQAHDSRGRDMPAWTGCRVLSDEVFLLLPEVAASFDGRYFGPIRTRAVIGRVTALWTPRD